ncbi:hypothetical protein [Zongyangia hominis]|uniref:Uncharacterized protein n=1 Tax=Zongyangia hominis TaxID=2763677 RepID=A0A926E958_9FIRM|nr:hypothetical protein [Zongyangia hominis]MBC8570200.1 hypothetical protein [Zongyangia hominis]
MSNVDESMKRVIREIPVEPEFHNLNAAAKKYDVVHNDVAGFEKVVDVTTAQVTFHLNM